ncbi:PH domain-containing protein [Haloplanus vescus]|uniref:PH domain-containing protein n=1 Tax=Haloplanus vescus TaxID=555874 RepID=A0A1H3WKG0_9EURY|nr:PH domain-containing protein [Haloplanus vescus]SDZ86688.1 PH domain-containing protein [Haloplanus vescus]
MARPDWLSLESDETVVWQGGPRLRRILPTAAAAVLWIAALVLAPQFVPTRALPTAVLVGGIVLLALPALAAVAWAYLRTTNVDYVLTDRNLYRKSGVLSTHVSRIGLSTVQQTSLTKSVWGNAFDYGTIELSTAGSDGVDLRLTDLDDPAPVREEIRRRIGPDQSDRDTAATLVDAATADTLRDEFRALRDAATRVERGCVSDE